MGHFLFVRLESCDERTDFALELEMKGADLNHLSRDFLQQRKKSFPGEALQDNGRAV
jgi:hypothetical protein